MLFIATLVWTLVFNIGNQVPNDPWLIVNGESVGHLRIGQNLLLGELGGPQSHNASEGAAAMGHFWQTWTGRKGHSLNIYTVRGEHDAANHPENIVKEIRVTSPSFHTASGLRVGQRVRSLPGFSAVNSWNKIKMRDDPSNGIAVETRNGKYTAIIVHPKRQNVLQIYLAFPGWTRS